MSLTTWSKKITLFTDGKNYLDQKAQGALQRIGIEVFPGKIKKLEGTGSQLKNIVFSNGQIARCDALFFSNGYTQQCDLAQALGCRMSKKGVVLTNRQQQTNVYGLYVAGDVAKDMHFVVVAAAEGAKAAVIMNKELQKEEIFRS